MLKLGEGVPPELKEWLNGTWDALTRLTTQVRTGRSRCHNRSVACCTGAGCESHYCLHCEPDGRSRLTG
jgi:hypothetical protein